MASSESAAREEALRRHDVANGLDLGGLLAGDVDSRCIDAAAVRLRVLALHHAETPRACNAVAWQKRL